MEDGGIKAGFELILISVPIESVHVVGNLRSGRVYTRPDRILNEPAYGYADSSMIARTLRSTSAARAPDPFRPVAVKSDVGLTVEIKQPLSLLKMEIRQGSTVDTLISVCNARVAASGLHTS